MHIHRSGDARDKQGKDIIDTQDTMFHNKANVRRETLARQVQDRLRRDAIPQIAEAIDTRREYREELQQLEAWLAF